MDAKFTKSGTNAGTEKTGLALLLTDPRFQFVDLVTKQRIVELVGGGNFGIQTFDAIVTDGPVQRVTIDNVDSLFHQIRLVEMKTTRKPILNSSLAGFFFGATEREYTMARTLGDRYLFAFVVLNDANEYGCPFAALLTLEEVERRTGNKRIQYQVNFRTNLAGEPHDERELVVFGQASHIPGAVAETTSEDYLG